MKLIYSDPTIKLCILDESYADMILDFYKRNRESFDIYDAKKPDNFYTREYIVNLIRIEYNAFLTNRHMRYYMFDNAYPDRIIGCVSFSSIDRSMRCCHIGYKIDEACRNMGYGKLMLSLALKAQVMDNRMHRIEAYIHPTNTASIKLAQAMGFVSEGTAYSYAMLDGRWQDHLRYVYIDRD